MTRPTGPRGRVEELRAAFDAVFAEPPPAFAGQTDDFLTVEVGTDSYALRLAEMDGVHRAPRLTPLPGTPGLLLGVATVRGRVVPVFDLASLLGYGRGEVQPPAIVLCRGERPVGLALGMVGRHFRVPSAEVQARGLRDSGRAHVHAFVRAEGAVRPVIDIGSVLEAIRARAAKSASARED
jgi:chemotaxis signal transduction protein